MQAYFATLRNKFRNNSVYNYLNLNRTYPVVTYHFLMALYLQHDMVDSILYNVAEQMTSINSSMTFNASNASDETTFLRVPVQYLKDKNFLNTQGLNFTILISNSAELDYARYLIGFWTNVIKPFIEANKNVFDNLPPTYSRLFTFTGSVTNGMCGN